MGNMLLGVTRTTVTLPPGVWFIGDPKIAIGDGSWQAAQYEVLYWPAGKVYGQPFAAFPASSRLYEDQEGGGYLVTSGFFGAVPVNVFPGSWVHLKSVGRIVTWTSATFCETKGHTTGVDFFRFGPYLIS